MYGYHCHICGKTHQMSSKIGREHYPVYLSEQSRMDKLADIERLRERKLSKVEVDRRLYKTIFGEKETKVMTTEKEKLLIPRAKTSEGTALEEYYEEEIAKYDVDDVYIDSFSTTSPPAFVHNEYRVTRKDKYGLWGVLVDSSFREMTAAEVY